MRKISLEKDYLQVFIIFLTVFIYFKFAYFLRVDRYPATLIFFFFTFNFFLSTTFFYFLSKITKKYNTYSSYLFNFSYSLFPTIIWFAANSVLYLFIPPPRTFSILGKTFTVIFIAFSLSVLIWKIILWYLALRFSTKAGFYQIIYLILLYLLWFIPYSLLLYYFKIFRVPFI